MFSILMVALFIATGFFYWASSNINHGVYWADRACHEVPIFCDHPSWLLAGAIVMVCLSLTWRMIKS